ncbi:T9SS C-terminal target domain-containing protein [bacterium]|nr:T9SS C-terminal target domain-containing protein [bacterium]
MNWVNPGDSDFGSILIRRGTSDFPTTNTGTLVTENTAAISFDDSGLSDGVYYYSLFSRDYAGNFGVPATLNVHVDITPPGIPSNFSVVQDGNRVVLNWENSTDSDLAEIQVRRSTSDIVTLESGTMVTQNANLQAWIDPNLGLGTYCYGVFSRDQSGNWNAGVTRSIEVKMNLRILQETSMLYYGDLTVTDNLTVAIIRPQIGNQGDATLNIESLFFSQSAELGGLSGSYGTVVVATPAGIWQDSGDVAVGAIGRGRIVQSAGMVRVAGALQIGGTAGAGGRVEISGGVFAAESVVLTPGMSAFHWTGGSLAVRRFGGDLANNGGILRVSNTKPIAISGNYSQSESGVIAVTLNSASVSVSSLHTEAVAPTGGAIISTTGNITVAGTLTVVLDGYTPAVGDVIRVFSSGINGAFSTLSLPNLDGGLRWNIDQLYTKGLITVESSGGSLLNGRPLNYPNPFALSTGTTIGFWLNQASDVDLRIYNSAGQQMYRKTFVKNGGEGGNVGYNRVVIDRSVVGNAWPSGIYFYMLIKDGHPIGKGKLAVLPE